MVFFAATDAVSGFPMWNVQNCWKELSRTGASDSDNLHRREAGISGTHFLLELFGTGSLWSHLCQLPSLVTY